MFLDFFFREGTIKDSSRKARRTVSGEALRKNTRFSRWDIRWTPKNGSRFLISTIFLRTGAGSFRRPPDLLTSFRKPASPRSRYAFTQCEIVPVLAPTSLLTKETGSPFSKCNFTQRSFNSNPYRFPNRLFFPLFFLLTSFTRSIMTLPSSPRECHPFLPFFLSHDLVVSPRNSVLYPLKKERAHDKESENALKRCPLPSVPDGKGLMLEDLGGEENYYRILSSFQ
jgi:hypothetical protein